MTTKSGVTDLGSGAHSAYRSAIPMPDPMLLPSLLSHLQQHRRWRAAVQRALSMDINSSVKWHKLARILLNLRLLLPGSPVRGHGCWGSDNA